MPLKLIFKSQLQGIFIWGFLKNFVVVFYIRDIPKKTYYKKVKGGKESLAVNWWAGVVQKPEAGLS